MRTIRIALSVMPQQNAVAMPSGGTMLQILIITMREGIEAFLIVAITAGILRQTGRAALLPALYWGTGIAVVASFIASVVFAQADNKPLWEGILAFAPTLMVATLTTYRWKRARS